MKVRMPRFRLYADTSVMGGCFDHEFVEASQALMTRVREGALTLVISELLIEELSQAPTGGPGIADRASNRPDRIHYDFR